MAKKFIGTFMDSKGNVIDAYGPIYGEWTEEKIRDLRAACKRKKASYCDVARVTGGHFVAFFIYDVKADKVIRQDRLPGRYGPGLY